MTSFHRSFLIGAFSGYLEKDAQEAGNMEDFRKDMARIINATDRIDLLLKDLSIFHE